MFQQIYSSVIRSMSVSRFGQAIAGLSPLSVGAIVLLAAPAQAFQFGFTNISGNSATNAIAGENQLLIDVTDASGKDNRASNQALFRFSNIGTAASSITQIYFDNGSSLKSMGAITNSGSGVSFSQTTGKMNLPAGNNVGFVSDFGLKANTPVSQKGVNPSEWVSVLFELGGSQTLESVINEITSGVLRFGMHVQAFADGGSEAFVNQPILVSNYPALAPVSTAVTPPAPAPAPVPTAVTPPAPAPAPAPLPTTVTPPDPAPAPAPVPTAVTPPAPAPAPVSTAVTPPAPAPAPMLIPAPSPPSTLMSATNEAPTTEAKKVPEPSTIVALGTIVIGAGTKRRQQKRVGNQG